MELQTHLNEPSAVVCQSHQIYYELFHQAGMSWKNTQQLATLNKIQHWSSQAQEITAWLAAHRADRESGKRGVLFLDKCQLL